ncbi:MAG: helix-turn-helix domain-containing protein [Saprospiraceae bacterium]|nr:helix-turn-helix domain-containing protein [Saprospiraceae bacterium]MCB9322969.1 helix-turn-helix domain-containing protein [Lewinellaceae bacterium]
MQNNNIILHSITPAELKELLRELVREEFENINQEMQRVIGEDDLVSTGTACRILGVCSKVLRYLVQEGHFTVFYHMKEKRYIRAELLDFRNQHRVSRLKKLKG